MDTTITDRQVIGLRDEALAAGDMEQYAVCQRALCQTGAHHPDLLDIIPTGWRVDLEHVIHTARGPVGLWDLRRDEARAECERVIGT